MSRFKILKQLPNRGGFPVDLRNPGWDKIALEQCNLQFGREKVDKVLNKFHRAKFDRDEIMDGVLKFDRNYAPAKRDEIYKAVLQSVRKDFVPEKKLIPLTIGGAIHHPDFPKDKSPGLPWRGTYKTKGDVLDVPENVDAIRKKWRLIGNKEQTCLPDTLIFFRAQICSVEKNKLRPVFGYPLEVFVEETRFLYPYMNWLTSEEEKKNDHPVAYGLEMIHGGMAYLQNMAQSAPRDSSFVMTDWSSFDTSVPPWLIRDAFSILKEAFYFDRILTSDGKVFEVDASITEARWKRMINYFINTPIRFSDGERVVKRGGVPSGSGFTNLIDTIVNAIVTRYICYNCTGTLPHGDVYMGDDGVCSVDGIVNLDDWHKVGMDTFGMDLSKIKSWVTQNPNNIHFLGFYNRDGVAYKPQDTIIASFIYPERKPDDVQTTCARALGQLWSSLNGIDAVFWLEIVERMIATYSIDREFIVDYLHKHPSRFRYLRQMGIDPRTVGIPERSLFGRVIAVEPEIGAPRNFRTRNINIHKLLHDYYLDPLILDLTEIEQVDPTD